MDPERAPAPATVDVVRSRVFGAVFLLVGGGVLAHQLVRVMSLHVVSRGLVTIGSALAAFGLYGVAMGVPLHLRGGGAPPPKVRTPGTIVIVVGLVVGYVLSGFAPH